VNSYERRVRAGADYLDAHSAYPLDWRDRLDVGALDLDNEKLCVIGQLRRIAWSNRGFNGSPESWQSKSWLRERGFIVPGTEWYGPLIAWRGTRRFARRKQRLAEAWRTYVVAERMKKSEQVR
jgi:hypothetical protein